MKLIMQMDDERWWKLFVEFQSSTKKQKKDIPANSPMQTHHNAPISSGFWKQGHGMQSQTSCRSA